MECLDTIRAGLILKRKWLQLKLIVWWAFQMPFAIKHELHTG